MKKFLSGLFLVLLVLAASIVAVPWNDFSFWGLSIPGITDRLTSYEFYVKGGIGALIIIISIIMLFVANKQYKTEGYVTNRLRNLTVVPPFAYAVAAMMHTTFVAFTLYQLMPTSIPQLLAFVGSAGILVALFVVGYILVVEYNRVNNLGRVIRTILLAVLAIATAGLGYLHYLYRARTAYPTMYSFYMVIAIAVIFVLLIIYLIAIGAVNKKTKKEAELEAEIVPKKRKHEEVPVEKESGRKTMIVSKQQTIVSGEENLDPTAMIYQDVSVDPEFARFSAPANQPNSIEYYIEKPKMFKPLSPTFDDLVAYVRELPQVVTKIDDDRITFYVDRKPFLVLMNFGNYYRLAFKHDLEQGIRLIIKYPTISKNKSTKDELWFKANNYGDIPQEVIYKIVKTAHLNYND